MADIHQTAMVGTFPGQQVARTHLGSAGLWLAVDGDGTRPGDLPNGDVWWTTSESSDSWGSHEGQGTHKGTDRRRRQAAVAARPESHLGCDACVDDWEQCEVEAAMTCSSPGPRAATTDWTVPPMSPTADSATVSSAGRSSSASVCSFRSSSSSLSSHSRSPSSVGTTNAASSLGVAGGSCLRCSPRPKALCSRRGRSA